MLNLWNYLRAEMDADTLVEREWFHLAQIAAHDEHDFAPIKNRSRRFLRSTNTWAPCYSFTTWAKPACLTKLFSEQNSDPWRTFHCTGEVVPKLLS